MRTTLTTADGVQIHAHHLPRHGDLAIVLAHGFAGSMRQTRVRRIAEWLNEVGGVVMFDFRGHGRSRGRSTLGDREVHDVDAAVRHAHALGYGAVVTVGFSMGACIVLRHAALLGGVDAVVAVSGPGRWFYRETVPMRRLHWVIERPLGRAVARAVLRTRISSIPWDPIPLPPADAAALLAPTPLLVVHGDRDLYLPVDHAEEIYRAAQEPKELWVVPGFGHAEGAATAGLVGRIGRWAATAVRGRAPQP